MNAELIEKIKQCKITKNTPSNVIRAFLNTGISGFLYSEIEGYTMEDKQLKVLEYLSGIEDKPIVKQVLNLVIADDSSSLEYVSYLNQKYEVIVHKTNDVKKIDDIDLVLFTGGEDVCPNHYNQPTGKYTSFNQNRDAKEIHTYNRFVDSVSMLGICRGLK